MDYYKSSFANIFFTGLIAILFLPGLIHSQESQSEKDLVKYVNPLTRIIHKKRHIWGVKVLFLR